MTKTGNGIYHQPSLVAMVGIGFRISYTLPRPDSLLWCVTRYLDSLSDYPAIFIQHSKVYLYNFRVLDLSLLNF